MQNDHLIPAAHFCTQYNIETAFIDLLHENGMIEIATVDQNPFIPEECLPEIEKIIRLHFELNINLEGIEAITYLLRRIENLQDEVVGLKNKLKLYEPNSENNNSE